MRVIIAGGSGFIGRRLIVELLRARHEVTVLSRRPENVHKIFPKKLLEAGFKFQFPNLKNALQNILH
ncbi:MAG: DUF1731 domain-containing protein [Bacteroidota bacterium]